MRYNYFHGCVTLAILPLMNKQTVVLGFGLVMLVVDFEERFPGTFIFKKYEADATKKMKRLNKKLNKKNIRFYYKQEEADMIFITTTDSICINSKDFNSEDCEVYTKVDMYNLKSNSDNLVKFLTDNFQYSTPKVIKWSHYDY